MNWLLLVVIALIAGNIVWGYSKGFLRVAYSLVEWLLIFLVISRGTPYVLDFLNENTNIPNLWGAAKAILRGKFIVIHAFLKKNLK